MEIILGLNFSAGIYYGVSGASQERYGYAGLNEVFKDPRAVRAVFVRDPLIRFLSAFLNKCMGIDTQNCPPWKSGGIVFREAVEWALNEKNMTNGHWTEQALHCNLQDRLHQYTVIGYMSKKTLSQDVSCLLNKVGFSNVTKKYFGTDQGPANASPEYGTTEEDTLKRFFTPTAARQLISRLQKDYDTFGFQKEPGWIAHATGELYEERMSKSAQNLIDDDEDDIGILA